MKINYGLVCIYVELCAREVLSGQNLLEENIPLVALV
jgi:hypothetical protein